MDFWKLVCVTILIGAVGYLIKGIIKWYSGN